MTMLVGGHGNEIADLILSFDLKRDQITDY
jgi:hypothetical protein